MKILKTILKILFTILYPILYPLVITPLNKLGSGQSVGFLKGLKNLWIGGK